MAEEILQVKRNGDFYYPIYFEEGFDRLADAICTEGLEGRNLCIVTDTHVEPLYAEKVKRVLTQVASRVSVFVFEAGERNKNLNTVQQLYKALIESCGCAWRRCGRRSLRIWSSDVSPRH